MNDVLIYLINKDNELFEELKEACGEEERMFLSNELAQVREQISYLSSK